MVGRIPNTMKNHPFIAIPLLASVLFAAPAIAGDSPKPDAEGFVSLFDGKTLKGWKVAERPEAVRIEDESIVTNGKRAHVFYVGDVNGGKFDDFELKLDVKTRKNSNGGVYIHTEYLESGWPTKGYEIQVNNTHSDWKKTGGLYSIQDNKKPFKDDEWMHYHIKVVGKKITVWVNGKKVVDYTEPENPDRPDDLKGRLLIPGGGTFALQGHDPGSTVFYRNIRVKPLN